MSEYKIIVEIVPDPLPYQPTQVPYPIEPYNPWTPPYEPPPVWCQADIEILGNTLKSIEL